MRSVLPKSSRWIKMRVKWQHPVWSKMDLPWFSPHHQSKSMRWQTETSQKPNRTRQDLSHLSRERWREVPIGLSLLRQATWINQWAKCRTQSLPWAQAKLEWTKWWWLVPKSNKLVQPIHSLVISSPRMISQKSKWLSPSRRKLIYNRLVISLLKRLSQSKLKLSDMDVRDK